MPARCRIVYQRAWEQLWQVTVHDENGGIICDLVSDGAWVEAGFKCWHIAYEYGGHYEAREERSACPDGWQEREDARPSLEMELSRSLWPMRLAEGHFFTRLAPWNWRCYRGPESNEILCRHRSSGPRPARNLTPWQRLMGRVARLRSPRLTMGQRFELLAGPGITFDVVLDENLGFAPVRSTFETDADRPNGAPDVELWEEPIALGDGLFVPRVHSSLQRLSEEPLLRVTLLPEESAFGVNIPLNIRPVDRTKERVDW